MIPNGKQIIIDGHNLTFESEPSDCRGCFFENRDSCPDCDEGLWVEEKPSPWHTGTPAEIEEDEYWKWNYVLVLNTEYDCIGDYLAGLLFAPDFERQVFTAPQGEGKELIVPFKDVVAWQKIEPCKEKS